jgi:hypothetical protein
MLSIDRIRDVTEGVVFEKAGTARYCQVSIEEIEYKRAYMQDFIYLHAISVRFLLSCQIKI